MRRRLLNLLTGLSVLLAAGACALWVRSYWVRDEAYRDRRAGDDSGRYAVAQRSGAADLRRNAVC